MSVTELCRLLRIICKRIRLHVIILASGVISTLLFVIINKSGTSHIHQKSHKDHSMLETIMPDSAIDDLLPIYADRNRRLYSACEATNGSGNTENILVYRNMSYGVVAKAGCTFWIRIFRFLHNDTNGKHLDNPFQMKRTETHGGHRTIKMYRLQRSEDRRVVMATTRFMVARNPFTRLFSAYIDKLFLPDLWYSAGKVIVSRRQNASVTTPICGHDVTFTEFLAYIADVGEVNPVSLNGHWRPIEHTCNPCTFRPHIVATQETFSHDSKYIMERFGLGHLLKNQSQSNHALDEMILLTDWNYGNGIRCLTKKGLVWRLWRTFQINGYLVPGSESVLDQETEATLTRDRLKHMLTESFTSSPISKEENRIQRKFYLKEAYSKVPRSVLDRIVKIYKNDFLYFGYNSSLEYLLA